MVRYILKPDSKLRASFAFLLALFCMDSPGTIIKEGEMKSGYQPASSWAGGDRKNRKRCSELRLYSVPSPSASVSAFAATGSLYDGSPVYGSYLDMEPMKRDATLAS